MDREESIKILEDVIKINSENGNEKEVAEYYQKVLKDHGIESKLVDFSEGRSSLVAEISNGEGKKLGLTGHMDVVSAGDLDKWEHDPFEAYTEDGIIWGRGASDMKSGLSALVIALIEMNEKKNFKGTIRLLATVGEEVGQFGSGQLTDEGYVDDLDAMIIGEPCNVGFIYAHMGSLNYKVVSKGVTSHSSSPEGGSNAIEHLVEAMSQITADIQAESEKYENEKLGKTFNNITLLKGGSQVNSIPDYAEFEANARTIPEYDNAALIETVKAVFDELNKKDGFELSVEVTADLPPVQAAEDSDLIKSAEKIANQHEKLRPDFLLHQMNDVMGGALGDIDALINAAYKDNKVKPMTMAGTTDAAQFTRANKDLQFFVYGPGMPMLSHKVNERIPLDQYIEFIEFYKEVIEDYLA
ncbi:MAG: ArgE/DapE family deacylase [Finegoldia sp.]|nr:ArgE/DapE family deacylase [Finegoldia sp.]